MSFTPTGTRSVSGNNRRILLAVAAVVVAIAFGALGFYLIEGWSILDSLYVAAQTVTTVGYGDIYPVTPVGRIIGVFTMVVGISTFALVTAKVAQFLVRPD